MYNQLLATLVTKDLKAQVIAAAKKEGRPVSQFLRRLIEKALKDK